MTVPLHRQWCQMKEVGNFHQFSVSIFVWRCSVFVSWIALAHRQGYRRRVKSPRPRPHTRPVLVDRHSLLPGRQQNGSSLPEHTATPRASVLDTALPEIQYSEVCNLNEFKLMSGNGEKINSLLSKYRVLCIKLYYTQCYDLIVRMCKTCILCYYDISLLWLWQNVVVSVPLINS